MVLQESWTRELIRQADQFDTTQNNRRFLLAHEELNIDRSYIHGRVLVGGGGDGQIERAVLCTPESNFRQPYPEIMSIWATDDSHPLLGKHKYTWPYFLGVTMPIEKALSARQSILSFGFDLKDLLVGVPQHTFDLITFFDIPDFADQLDDELLTLLKKTLAPKGVFMGSGGTRSRSFSGLNTLEDVIERIKGLELNPLTIKKLEDFEYSVAPSIDRIGVVLQKQA